MGPAQVAWFAQRSVLPTTYHLRVLRPGGRPAVADLVLDEELPPELTTSDDAWAG